VSRYIDWAVAARKTCSLIFKADLLYPSVIFVSYVTRETVILFQPKIMDLYTFIYLNLGQHKSGIFDSFFKSVLSYIILQSMHNGMCNVAFMYTYFYDSCDSLIITLQVSKHFGAIAGTIRGFP
jgi:hypothetical protein